MSFFNAPIKIPKGSGLNVENGLGDVMTVKSSQSTFTGGNFTLYFPNTYGLADQVLKTDGTGNLSWTTVSGGGGSSTVPASNITIGSANVSITTTSGNVRINAPAGEVVQLQVANTDVAVISGTNVTISTQAFVTNTTQASSVGTAAVVLSGGLGVAKNAYVGGNVFVTSTVESTNIGSGALIVSGGAGINSNLNIGGNVNVTNNAVMSSNLTVNGATESTNIGSGSLIIAGGVGISKNINVGGNLSVTNATTLNGNVNVQIATQSTSAGSGALVVSGGVGIGKDAYVGGNVVISGDLTVNGTTTTVNSNIVSIDDPVIELGTAGIADSFDRGIIGLYDTRKLFFGWNNSANVFTFVPDATVTSGSNVVTGTAGKAVFGEIVAGSNVTINNTTQSTNTGSGALVVGGGVGIASNLNVGGNVNVTSVIRINDSSESSGITSGALQVLGGIGASGSINTGGNLSVTKQVVYSVDSFTSVTNVTNTALALWSGSATATIKHLLPPTNEAQYYHSNTSITYTTGQHMDVFFTRPAANTNATANIDFGSSNLYSGTGTAQYLVFTQPGQSASLVFLGGADSVKGWRIINTGAQVY